MNADRNPVALWKALSEIVAENENFRNKLEIKLIGKTDFTVFEAIERFKLKDFVVYEEYINHKEVILETCSAQYYYLPLITHQM
jgi:hypothetical protein